MTSLVLSVLGGRLESDCDRRMLFVLVCGMLGPCFTAGKGEEGDHGCFEGKLFLLLPCRFCFFSIGLLCGELRLGLAFGRTLSAAPAKNVPDCFFATLVLYVAYLSTMGSTSSPSLLLDY